MKFLALGLLEKYHGHCMSILQLVCFFKASYYNLASFCINFAIYMYICIIIFGGRGIASTLLFIYCVAVVTCLLYFDVDTFTQLHLMY